MTAVILDGKATAAAVKADLATRVAALNAAAVAFPSRMTAVMVSTFKLESVN